MSIIRKYVNAEFRSECKPFKDREEEKDYKLIPNPIEVFTNLTSDSY